jgi:integrase
MKPVPSLDRAGRRRSPATLASFHQGRAPHNKGLQYPPDPPTVEEIISVMRAAGDDADGVRLRALIIVLWRAGLRISEALALAETDLDLVRGAILVRHGKGGKRREVDMDRWAGSSCNHGLSCARACRSVRSSASCTDPRAGAAAVRPGSERNSIAPRPRQGSGVGSRRINSGTLTQLRCPGREFRWW